MTSKVNEMKSENSRSKNEVDNLISSIDKIKKETDDNLKKLKEEIIKEMKEETDDNFKKLKVVMASTVNELKKDNNDKLNSLKNENSRSKNEVDNLILLVNEIKKGTDDNFKNLKLEMASSVNELKKEIVSTFKMSIVLFGAPHGIQNNIHVSKLTGSGYSYVYNKPYNHKTTSSEMDEIKKSCLPTTILCLGGRDSTNDVLLVVSCGLCSVVFTKTAKNTPNLHNGAYWYYTPDVEHSRSIGFAPNSTIHQFNSDTFDKSNNQRVSWLLNIINWGGYRLGSLSELYYDTRYYKVILKRDD
jgi:hypothetical protein